MRSEPTPRHRSRSVLLPAAAATGLIALLVLPAARPPAPGNTLLEGPRADRSVWDSVYTATQAKRGADLYYDKCVKCHGEDLEGVDDGAPLKGQDFLVNWNGKMLAELNQKMREMPPDTPPPPPLEQNKLSDILAFLLQYNGFPAGNAELPPAADSLKSIRFEISRKTDR